MAGAKVNEYLKTRFASVKIYKVLAGIGAFWHFTVRVFSSIKKIDLTKIDSFVIVVFKQIKFTGHKAMPLISVISLIIGASTILQAVTFLPKFGQDDFIGNLLKLVIVREIGPLITGIIILTRSGSAIAAEIATQKLHQEIKELELIGINTAFYIVLPRIIGGIVATGLLIFYFDFIAFFGGYILANFVSSIPFSTFMEAILKSIALSDILAMAIKSLFFGIFIPLTCSFYGFQPNALFEIPIYVSKAVVRSLVVVFLLNILISVIFYL